MESAATAEVGGAGAGAGGALTGKATNWDWRVSAQKRVLTGLVLAVLVFLMATTGVLGWVAASWAVL